MNGKPLPHWDPGWETTPLTPKQIAELPGWAKTLASSAMSCSEDEAAPDTYSGLAQGWATLANKAMSHSEDAAVGHVEHVLTCKACAAQNEAHDVRLDQLRRKARKWKRRYLKAAGFFPPGAKGKPPR